MKAKLHYIILFLLIIALIISSAMNIVMVKKVESMHIMGYDRLGLVRLGSETICRMYVDAYENPNYAGEFYNAEALTPLFEIMKTGCYQKAPDVKIDSGNGSGVCDWVRIETDQGTYAIAAYSHVVRITINGESQCYYTNICIQLADIIRDIAENELAVTG